MSDVPLDSGFWVEQLICYLLFTPGFVWTTYVCWLHLRCSCPPRFPVFVLWFMMIGYILRTIDPVGVYGIMPDWMNHFTGYWVSQTLIFSAFYRAIKWFQVVTQVLKLGDYTFWQKPAFIFWVFFMIPFILVLTILEATDSKQGHFGIYTVIAAMELFGTGVFMYWSYKRICNLFDSHLQRVPNERIANTRKRFGGQVLLSFVVIVICFTFACVIANRNLSAFNEPNEEFGRDDYKFAYAPFSWIYLFAFCILLWADVWPISKPHGALSQMGSRTAASNVSRTSRNTKKVSRTGVPKSTATPTTEVEVEAVKPVDVEVVEP